MGASQGNLGEGSYDGAYVWKKFHGRVSIYMGPRWETWEGVSVYREICKLAEGGL